MKYLSRYPASFAVFLLLLASMLASCNANEKVVDVATEVFYPQPEVKVNGVQSFALKDDVDNLVKGIHGTLVVCRAGCFKNSKGQIIKKGVTLELKEALTMAEMIFSDLNTTSNGKPLISDGMVHISAKSGNDLLSINSEIPIHIEMPTKHKKPGMMVYKGIRESNGQMNWTEPKAPDAYLVPVCLASLDFLPPGFESAVEEGMPFKNYRIATKELVDSLYYSLSAPGSHLAASNLSPPPAPAPAKAAGESYTDGDKQAPQAKNEDEVENYHEHSESEGTSLFSGCGIDPAIIKTIRSEKFEHTLISTREFEARLCEIFKACNNGVIELYIKNTGKPLYVVDSLAADMLKGTKHEQVFRDFAVMRLTNVKDNDIYANLIAGFYESELAKVQQELANARKNYLKDLNDKSRQAKLVVDQYRQLLNKREAFRMETYGFNWTDTGWINIDTGTSPKSWASQQLEVVVNNGKQFDRVYTYVIYQSIRSLYKMNTEDNILFYPGNISNKEMLMPTKKIAICIAIGYKNESVSIAVKKFEIGTIQKLQLKPEPTTKENFERTISAYDYSEQENRISKDLEYSEKLYVEEKRQQALQSEWEFIEKLNDIAFPCCIAN